MATTPPAFEGLPARGDPVPRGPRREQRTILVPAAQGRVRATAQGAAGGVVRRARRPVPRARHPARRRSGQIPVPHLSRRPFLEGQVAVQDEHRGVVPVRRRPRGRRAATSTSPPARSTSAVACGIPDRARLAAWRAVVDRGVGLEPLEDPAFVATFGQVGGDRLSRVPQGSRRTTRGPTCSRSRTSRSAAACRTTRRCRPGLPDILADDFAAAVPVFRLLGSLPA